MILSEVCMKYISAFLLSLFAIPTIADPLMDRATILEITPDCKFKFVEYIPCNTCINGNVRVTHPIKCWVEKISFSVKQCKGDVCGEEMFHVHECRTGYTDPLSTYSSRYFIKNKCLEQQNTDYLFKLYQYKIWEQQDAITPTE